MRNVKISVWPRTPAAVRSLRELGRCNLVLGSGRLKSNPALTTVRHCPPFQSRAALLSLVRYRFPPLFVTNGRLPFPLGWATSLKKALIFKKSLNPGLLWEEPKTDYLHRNIAQCATLLFTVTVEHREEGAGEVLGQPFQSTMAEIASELLARS